MIGHSGVRIADFSVTFYETENSKLAKQNEKAPLSKHFRTAQLFNHRLRMRDVHHRTKPMATFMQHVYIPLELIDEICSYAEISSQLCLMRTSRQMHAALSYNVYREASVRGFTARQFFATVSCGSSHAQLYASSIRHLTYRGTSLEDTFITFPLFVNALLKMCRLRTLSLSVGKSVSAFLTVQLDKTGINRQCQSLSVSLNPLKKLESCIWALPHLTSLNISGDHRLTSLARCRQLTRLRVGVPISVADLSDVLTNLVDGKGGVNHSLTSLLINFHNATCEETSLAFICIAQMLPSLFDLTLRIPVVNPLVSHYNE